MSVNIVAAADDAIHATGCMRVCVCLFSFPFHLQLIYFYSNVCVWLFVVDLCVNTIRFEELNVSGATINLLFSSERMQFMWSNNNTHYDNTQLINQTQAIEFRYISILT